MMPESSVSPASSEDVRFIDFRGSVERLLSSSLSELNAVVKAPFALLHYYWGNHEERGSVRISAVAPNVVPSKGRSLDLFQRHLMQFGQHLSLLRWVYFFALQGRARVPIQVIRFEMTADGAMIERRHTEGFVLHIVYNENLADRLFPPKIRERHANNLTCERGYSDLRKDFAIALGHAKGLLRQADIETAVLLGRALPGAEDAEPEAALLSFLTALQSARAFLDSVAPERARVPHLVDFFCVFGNDDISPPSITLFTLREGEGARNGSVGKEQLTNILSEVATLIDRGQEKIPGAFDGLVCKQTAALIYQNGHAGELRPEWKNAFTLLDERFPLPKFRLWRDCVLIWITSLISHLRANIHEGKRLEFWLAAGDRTEVLDSGRFEITWVDPMHIAPIAVPEWPGLKRDARSDERDRARAAIERARAEAVRVVSRENYVWFTNGQYALFWDVTSLGRFPIGLLRPIDGNWDWYLDQRGKKDDRDRWPELVLAFERKDGSGGVVIGATQVASLAEQVRRVEIVRGLIRDWGVAVGVSADHTDEVLSDLIVRIADDPDAGCSVVFANESPSDKFMKMGYPWMLWEPMLIEKSRYDEIRRFMEMDGATCVWFDATAQKWKIDFQFLLHGDEGIIRRWIPRVRIKHELKLRGSGARRWSAAVAASQAIVRLVIVASQDGDIYGFRKEPNGALKMIESKKPSGVPGDLGLADAYATPVPMWETLIEGLEE